MVVDVRTCTNLITNQDRESVRDRAGGNFRQRKHGSIGLKWIGLGLNERKLKNWRSDDIHDVKLSENPDEFRWIELN